MSEQAPEGATTPVVPTATATTTTPQASTASASSASKSVASNAKPTLTSGDEFAQQARDKAVEARAQAYEEDGNDDAAQRVRSQLTT